MRPILALLLAVIAGSQLAPTAAAEGRTFRVALFYTATDPAADIYQDLETGAAKACRREINRAGLMGIATRRHMAEACTADVLESAVNTLGLPELIAVHRDRTGRTIGALAMR